MIDTRFYRTMGALPLSDLIEGLAVDLPDPKFGDEMISAASTLAESQSGHISFLDNKRHKSYGLFCS